MTNEKLEKANSLEKRIKELYGQVALVEKWDTRRLEIAQENWGTTIRPLNESTRNTIKTIVAIELKQEIDNLQAQFDAL